MASKFPNYPNQPTKKQVEDAFHILCSAHESASSFLTLFEEERKRRKAVGTSTDEDQDLLRAMLSFASSGLDAMAKQLVRDALPDIITANAGAAERFKGYVEKAMRRGEEMNYKLIAGALSATNSQGFLIRSLVYDLTSESLQSKDQLLSVASFFDIPSGVLSKDFKLLEDIFEARNQISHEMDIDFTVPNRSRRPRGKEKMITFTSELLRLANEFLKNVENRLP